MRYSRMGSIHQLRITPYFVIVFHHFGDMVTVAFGISTTPLRDLTDDMTTFPP